MIRYFTSLSADSLYGELKQHIFSPLVAGILIGIAGCAYLSTGGLPGAVLFAIGLMGVVCWKINLFTGKAGFWSGWNILRLIPVLLLNICGVVLVALISMKPERCEICLSIIEKRFSAPTLNLFFLSSLCGLIMTTAVKFGREGNWWPLLLGVPTFIMCGFPHCIADIYYWTAAIESGYKFSDAIPVYLITVAGNYAGCNIPRLIPGFTGDPTNRGRRVSDVSEMPK